MRRKIVAGNWKMNGQQDQNQALLAALVKEESALSAVDVWVAPPSVYIPTVLSQLKGSAIKVLAQNVAEHDKGAYTGEVSAMMLVDVGCFGVLIGHSERRQYYAESNAVVLAKVKQALSKNLLTVLCVGETLAEREAGLTEEVVLTQLSAIVDACDEAELARMVVAYEPVWAIGTGLTATPEQAQIVHAHIRAKLAAVGAENVAVLYGGSVKAANAEALFAMPDIDGALVGGASLDAQEFLAIARAASDATVGK